MSKHGSHWCLPSSEQQAKRVSCLYSGNLTLYRRPAHYLQTGRGDACQRGYNNTELFIAVFTGAETEEIKRKETLVFFFLFFNSPKHGMNKILFGLR